MVKPVSEQPYNDATARLKKFLFNHYADCVPLLQVEIDELAPQGAVLEGWKFSLDIEKKSIEFALMVDISYPFSSPRIVILEHDHLYLEIPHLEQSGKLCLLTENDKIDVKDNVGVAGELISDAKRIVEDGLSGKNQSDFQSEFLSYWNRYCCKITGLEKSHVSILNINNRVHRKITLLRFKSIQLLSESFEQGVDWLAKKFAIYGEVNRAKLKKEVDIQTAIFIWLPEPLLPSQYPKVNKDIWDWGKHIIGLTPLLVEGTPTDSTPNLPIVFGFETESGPVLGGCILPEPKINQGPKKKGKKKRRGKPSLQQAQQFFAYSASLIPYRVQRADLEWLHFRGGSGLDVDAREIRIGIIGCGSLGCYVADFMCRAGVGKLVLIDDDDYCWDNVGRHLLPNTFDGINKSKALREYLLQNFPQEEIQAIPHKWEEAYVDKALVNDFRSLDLLISTTGDYASNLYINGLFLTEQFFPPIICAWAEAYCVAGHAILIDNASSCLSCGFDSVSDQFRYEVSQWDDNQQLIAPACGDSFMPYGSLDMMPIATMTSRLALDFIYGRTDGSELRSWVSSVKMITDNGGRIAAYWDNKDTIEMREIRIQWTRHTECKVCQN